MAGRIRYLSSSPISRKKLALACDAFVRKEYSDKVAWGFLDVRNEGDALTATFIERFESEDEIYDPFGGITKYKRIRFNQTRVRLGLISPQLEVFDGPRSLSPLLTELSAGFANDIGFSRIGLNLSSLLKDLKRETSSLSLVSAALEDITLSPDVYARVLVVGAGEVGPYLKQASMGHKCALTEMCVKGTWMNSPFKLEISSDGRLEILQGEGEELMLKLRNAVEKNLH
jgi:hypothetical protein